MSFIQKAPYPYLYFIDFDLGKGELNGIDLGHLILKQDPAARIIFITSHVDKGMDILKSGVRAYGFIEKSPEKQTMILEYMKYLNMIQPDFANPTKIDCIELSMGLDEKVTIPLSQNHLCRSGENNPTLYLLPYFRWVRNYGTGYHRTCIADVRRWFYEKSPLRNCK